MARRVYFHIGAPKTGTTYLQRVMWHNRAALRAAGVLIPGEDYRDRVWATQTVREMKQPDRRAAAAWDRIVRQVHAFDGDAVISHEFFSAASKEQAARAIDALAPGEVHIVYTARDLTRLIPALWQERLKYRYQGTFGDFRPAPVTAPPRAHWSWRTIDVVDVLQRWSSTLPPEHVHVVTVPRPGAPRTVLWTRFATACGFDPAVVSLDVPAANESMGLVESELLRHINPRIGEEISGITEVPTWVRDYLGLRVLAERKGEKIGLDPHRHARMRKRSITVVEQLRQAGYDVVGDLDELIAPVTAPPFRQPEDVTTEELLDASLDVIAQMLSDYREVARERQQLRRRVETLSWRRYTEPARLAGALRRRLGSVSRRRPR
jgi:hypothetical protein